MKSAFVFICQAGELELKSALLAASLKLHLQGEYELIAAVPRPASVYGEPTSQTIEFLASLGVRTAPVENHISPEYPIGNKINCLGIDTDADKIIFLDSDIVCLRPFAPPPRFARFALNIKPADLMLLPWGQEDWQRLYGLFGLPPPRDRIVTSVSGEPHPPYFNAGFIATGAGLGFAAMWEECCRRIDAEAAIQPKRPWLDQIALPIAVARLGLAIDSLDERYNFPAHSKPLPDSHEYPFFCHYHWPSILRREPRLNQQVLELAALYPGLADILRVAPEWANLLQPYRLSQSKKRWLSLPKKSAPRFIPNRRDLIITGIPRSGTSYACRLLHSLENCIAINEPEDIFAPLAHNSNDRAWQFPLVYQDYRRKILDGIPVTNRLHQGKVIENTAQMDARSEYVPEVSRPDFVLASKNTLAYLARLPQLRRAMPHAPIAACIRHPLDAIASWKATFPHLREAKVAEIPVGNLQDPYISGWQRRRLEEIQATADLPLRRALFWRYLAELIAQNQRDLYLIRYEALVSKPEQVLRGLWRLLPGNLPFKPINPMIPSQARQQREVLDAEDLAAIRKVCSQSAAELGYELE